MDVIYVQAKRWEGSIGRPEIQEFAGALQGHRAKKRIFITTSHFTKDAEDYAQSIESRIVLIDGGVKPNAALFADAYYEDIQGKGTAYRSTIPRSIA